MPLINFAWSRSFARLQQNKKAIVDRGWNPLNYNLLTNPELRATMTVAEKSNKHTKVCLSFEFRDRGIVANEGSNTTNDVQQVADIIVCSQQTSSASLNSAADTGAATTTSLQSSLNFPVDVAKLATREIIVINQVLWLPTKKQEMVHCII